MSTTDSSLPDVSAETRMAAALRGEALVLDGLNEAEQEALALSAIEHGVAPLLHHVLSQSDSWHDYPAPFRELLAQPARQTMALDMLREKDLGELLDQLAGAGIRYLLIKGAGLAYTHYPRPYLRARCDTDILFPDQATFDRAWALLESLGYERRNTLSGEHVGYQHCCWRRLGPGFHQVLDCHIKINDYAFYANTFGFDELYEGAVPVPQLAKSARTLGPVHALLMACMHRVATIPLGDADRLIWLYDMHLLGQSFSADNWQAFLQIARDRRICGTCQHSLAAAARFFPLAVPADVLAELARAAESEAFKPGEEMKRWQYYFHVLKSTPGVGGKARLLREHFIPSPDYLMAKYQTSNRLLLPWLYVHRVFSGLKRYF